MRGAENCQNRYPAISTVPYRSQSPARMLILFIMAPLFRRRETAVRIREAAPAAVQKAQAAAHSFSIPRNCPNQFFTHPEKGVSYRFTSYRPLAKTWISFASESA